MIIIKEIKIIISFGSLNKVITTFNCCIEILFNFNFAQSSFIFKFAFHHIISKSSWYYFSISFDDLAFSTFLIICPISFIYLIFLLIIKSTFSFFFILYKLTYVDISYFRIFHSTFTISFIVFPISLIHISIKVSHLSFSLLHIFIMLTKVNVSILIEELSNRFCFSFIKFSLKYNHILQV